jgi:hypothetical protein
VEPLKLKKNADPEAKLQRAWIEFLRARGWFVKPTHGGLFQAGFPDLFTSHPGCGPKWIEIKLPDYIGSRLTIAQKETFPAMMAHGCPIWILTTCCESEYRKLFTYTKGNAMEMIIMKG